MIEHFRRADNDGAVPRVAPNGELARRRDERRRRAGDQGHHARRRLDQRRLLRASDARSSTRSSPGEELVEEPFQRLIERGALMPIATTASGRRWTRSRTSSSSSALGVRLGALAPRRAAHRIEDLDAASDLPLPARAPHVLAIGCHSDDIEIGCGGTLLTLLAARPDVRVTWVVLQRRARARRRRRPARRRSSPARERRRSSSSRSGTVSCPTSGPGEGGLRAAEGAARPGPHPHALGARPAPGSPARLGAHVEHLPPAPDPRVRDPEVRRRPRQPRRVRAADRGRGSSGRWISCASTSRRRARSTGSTRSSSSGSCAFGACRRTSRRATPRRSTRAS